MGKQYYDEPNRELMKKFIIFDMKIQKGQSFTTNDFIEKYKTKYPEFENGSIKNSLTRLSVNDLTRDNYKPSKNDDFLWKLNEHTFRLYDEENDEKTNTKKPKSILIKKDKI